MKRFLSIFAVLLLLLAAVCPSAMAEEYNERAYYLEDLYMMVDVPEDLVTFTRDELPDEDTLAYYGFGDDDVKRLLEGMAQSDTYLRALSFSPLADYVIMMAPAGEDSDVFNFNDYSDDQLEGLFLEAQKSMGQYGMSYENYTVYQHPQAKFLAMTYTIRDGDNAVYGLQYYTVYNGLIINMVLRSYNEPISSAAAARHRGIVESAYFFETLDEPGDSGWEFDMFDVGDMGEIVKTIFTIIVFVVVIIIAVAKSGKKKAKRGGTDSQTPYAPSPDRPAAPAQAPRPAKGSARADTQRALRQEHGETHGVGVDDPTDAWDYTTDYKRPVAYCPSCGAKVYEGSKTCPLCGAKVKKRRGDEL